MLFSLILGNFWLSVVTSVTSGSTLRNLKKKTQKNPKNQANLKNWIFFGFYGFLYKVTKILLKVTKVTTGNQKWPKQHNKVFFLPEGLGRSPPQELEVGPCSGPYLLVFLIGASC